eukprot:gene27134-32778_t
MINQAVLKFQTPPHPRHTLVLLTGDGNDNDGRASFFSAVSKALENGWAVELWTWRLSVSRNYLDLLMNYGDIGLFKIMYLDLYRDDITFKHGQKSNTVDGEKKEDDWMMKKSKNRAGGTVMKMVGEIQRKTSFTAQSSSNAQMPPPAPTHTAPSLVKATSSNNRFAPIDLISDDESDEEKADIDDGDSLMFTCPLTHVVLEQPVGIPSCPQLFEREALVNWVKKRGTCPLSGEAVSLGDIHPAPADFVSRLEKYKKAKK